VLEETLMPPVHCNWCGAELLPFPQEAGGTCLECKAAQQEMPPETIPYDELFDANEVWP
jgi:hypothetical protein